MSKAILYIGEMELPDKNAAAHRVVANSEIIRNSTNHEVIIVGLNKSFLKNQVCESNLIDFDYKIFEYKYPETPIEWFKYITSISYIKNIINTIEIKNIEAIIAYNYPAIALNKLRLFCFKNNIKLISDVSEWYGKSKRNFPSNFIKDFDTFLRMRVVNKKCKNLICASKYLADYYSKRGCNVVNIPSLVRGTNYLQALNMDSCSKNNQYKIFSFVGSPGKSKEKERIDWIINFFHSVKERGDFKLILVGVTKESLISIYPDIKYKVEELKNHITFMGRVAHSEAIQIIKKSHFTVFARMINRVTSAGFPTKLAESFSCGTPVVTTPSSNIRDFIDEGKSGFVSQECDLNSFSITLLKALDCSLEEVLEMKDFIKANNPLSLYKFEEDWESFYFGEKL